VSYVKRAINRVVREPAVTLGVLVATINTAEDQTWKGYGLAVLIALGRFVVSPAYGK
jgi:hypothetical protein